MVGGWYEPLQPRYQSFTNPKIRSANLIIAMPIIPNSTKGVEILRAIFGGNGWLPDDAPKRNPKNHKHAFIYTCALSKKDNLWNIVWPWNEKLADIPQSQS